MAGDGLDRPNRGWKVGCLMTLHNSVQHLLQAFSATPGFSDGIFRQSCVEGTPNSDLGALGVAGDESSARGSSPSFFCSSSLLFLSTDEPPLLLLFFSIIYKTFYHFWFFILSPQILTNPSYAILLFFFLRWMLEPP